MTARHARRRRVVSVAAPLDSVGRYTPHLSLCSVRVCPGPCPRAVPGGRARRSARPIPGRQTGRSGRKIPPNICRFFIFVARARRGSRHGAAATPPPGDGGRRRRRSLAGRLAVVTAGWTRPGRSGDGPDIRRLTLPSSPVPPPGVQPPHRTAEVAAERSKCRRLWLWPRCDRHDIVIAVMTYEIVCDVLTSNRGNRVRTGRK